MRSSFTVNGQRCDIDVEPRRLLLDVLRDDLELTGTHAGCEYGVCGACTIMLDGYAVRSCLLFAVQCSGHHVTTVEGLGSAGDLHPVQQAFAQQRALQCGFCTPGFVVTLASMTKQYPALSSAALAELLSGNICRCTGYGAILAAVTSLLENDPGSADGAPR